MSFPASHTIGAFLADHAKRIGAFKNVAVDGSYRLYKEYKQQNIDTLNLDFNVRT
jgi:hypothetical protein